MRRLPHTIRASLIALTLAAAACGGRAAAPPPPVLPAAAIRYLPSTSRTLDAGDLAGESGVGSLADELDHWGFLAGAERTFQGQSHALQIVVSRTLEFRDAAGAAAYVGFVHRHADVYLGDASTARPLAAGRRHGWLFIGPPCACHMSSPLLIGVVQRGPRVSWLSVNGPTADRRALARLLSEAP